MSKGLRYIHARLTDQFQVEGEQIVFLNPSMGPAIAVTDSDRRTYVRDSGRAVMRTLLAYALVGVFPVFAFSKAARWALDLAGAPLDLSLSFTLLFGAGAIALLHARLRALQDAAYRAFSAGDAKANCVASRPRVLAGRQSDR